MNTSFNNILRTTLYCVLLLAGVSACSNNQSASVDFDAEGNSFFKMQPPAVLNTRAIDYSTLEPQVRINNVLITMSADGDQWVGSATVPENADADISIKWIETSLGDLLLAQAEKRAVNVNQNISLEILDSDYKTDGDIAFDVDEDGISNIDELVDDTDPNDANDPGAPSETPPPTVRVIPDGVGITEALDGRFGPGGFWNLATFDDITDNNMQVNNLINDETGTHRGETVGYTWAALHDETNLSLFIFGKEISGNITANGDSGENMFQDDSVEIFIDGNNSRGNFYDDEDDLLIMIPLVTEATEENQSASPDKRIQFGTRVSSAVREAFDLDDESVIEFGTCLCGGERSTWEVRINMAAANITVGQPFGFDIQINRDDDGGPRDSKWAWHAPALTADQSGGEADRTWRQPNLMGQILLLPF